MDEGPLLSKRQKASRNAELEFYDPTSLNMWEYRVLTEKVESIDQKVDPAFWTLSTGCWTPRWVPHVEEKVNKNFLPAHGKWLSPDGENMCSMQTWSRNAKAQMTFANGPSAESFFIFRYANIRLIASIENGNKLVILSKNCYSKPQAVSTLKKTPTHTETLFSDHWIVPYALLHFSRLPAALNSWVNSYLRFADSPE